MQSPLRECNQPGFGCRSIRRINEIEGLRAYLAFWVVLSHVIVAAGYSFENHQMVEELMRSGNLAVDIFIMISGFVIFYLLDNRPQSHLNFVVGRFFRLWPLFIVLFCVAIPLSLLESCNIREMESIYGGNRNNDAELNEGVWNHLTTHIALHLPMLHGMVPTTVLPGAQLRS